MHSLILGGARSGKSALAERIARDGVDDVVVLATAQALDAEMQTRIAYHRAARSTHWAVVEEPLHVAQALARASRSGRCVIVDCLSLWLSNLLCSTEAGIFERERDALLDVLNDLPGRLLLISNEVGLGVIPMGELTRRYVDEAGRLHQQLATRCSNVIFCVAGLPHVLKGALP